MAVLPAEAEMPGNEPGRALFLEGGGNDRPVGNGALEAQGPPRRDRDQPSILSLLFPHSLKRLPVLPDSHAKA
jgi:hypothetical protein